MQGDRFSARLADLPRRKAEARIAGDPLGPGLPEPELALVLKECLDQPSRAAERFAAWIESGADVLLAPTLTATPAGLKPLGLAHRAAEVNRAALDAARSAAARATPAAWVAAQMGPLGPGFGRCGFFSFDEAYIHYHEQAKALAQERPDLIVVRQIRDLRLLRAALVAIRELWSGLVIVLLDPLRLEAQGGPAQCDPLVGASDVVSSLRVQGIGVEGTSDLHTLEGATQALRLRSFPLVGALLPPGTDAAAAIRLLAGSGTDLLFLEGEEGLRALKAMDALTRPTVPGRASAPAEPLACAASPPVPPILQVAMEVAWEMPAAVGEPAGSDAKSLAPEHIVYSGVRILAQSDKLVSEGLRRRQLEERVAAVESRDHRPILIVARDPLVLEAGLKAARGRCIAYLDSLDTTLWQSVFYLAYKYGAKLGVRLLPTAARPGERASLVYIPAVLRLFEAAREYSLQPEDLYVDPIGMGEPEGPAWDRETIEAVLRQMPWAKRETGARWILGCHHFRQEAGGPALPGPAFQSEVLSIALFQGLDAVILGPDQTHLIETLKAHQGWGE